MLQRGCTWEHYAIWNHYKRAHIIWLHLYEMSSIGKSLETESKFVVAWDEASNQSIWKEISPEYSLEGLMLKLKLRYFDHLMQRADSFEKTLMLGKIEGGKRRGPQRMR